MYKVAGRGLGESLAHSENSPSAPLIPRHFTKNRFEVCIAPIFAAMITMNDVSSIPKLSSINNYFEWRMAIRERLLIIDCLGVANGTEPRPLAAATDGLSAVLPFQELPTGGGLDKETDKLASSPIGVISDQTRREMKAWDTKDSKARGLILSTVDDGYKFDLLDCATAYEMWTTLEKLHDFSSADYIADLRGQVYGLLLREGGDMEAHLANFEALMLRAREAGLYKKDSMGDPRIRLFLISLPKSLSHITLEFRMLPPGERTWVALRRIFRNNLAVTPSSRRHGEMW